LARLTEASAAAAMAHDLGPAAAATASLGATCGACHEATGADPMFDPDPPPMQDEGAAAAMRRHQWGVDRMWEGLIMPSQESWRWGAETIDETPGCTDVDPEDAYRIELCQKVEALGRSALDARTRDDRTRIYGEFLATCSSCHQASAGEVTWNSENFRNSSAPDERAGVARRSKYARYAFGRAPWHARR